MTFAARPLVAVASGGSSLPALGTMNLGGVAIESADLAVAITLNADGTITWLNQMNNGQVTPSVVNWYTPTTGAIGAGYRVRFTLQSGTAWASGLTSGTLYALSSARQVLWTLPITGLVQAQVLVEITSSGDTTVLGSGTLIIDMIDEY